MPELPEVETIVRQLAEPLSGRLIAAVEVHRPDLLREPPELFCRALAGCRVQSVTRRGKNVVLRLSGPQVLLVNLGMTGRLLLDETLDETGSPREAPPYLCVSFSLAPGGTLHYVDVRRFGRILRLSEGEWKIESGRLGAEPLDPRLSAERMKELLRGSRAPLHSCLLDQHRLAGIGNIYASESLFRARLHPRREAGSLNLRESEALLDAVRAVLQEAIRARGTTIRDYRTATGDEGGFGPALQVYGHQGDPCPRCKTPIQRLVLANRSAFYCPSCQRQEPPSDS